MWMLMESDSDEEEETRMPRRSLFHLIRTNYNLNENIFREAFRVDVEVFNVLERVLSPYLAVSRRNNSLSPREQILTARHFLGNGAQYHINGLMHTISKSTVCRCVHRVCRLIATHLMPLYVRWPPSSQMVEYQFYRKANFPHVKGVIDGSLVYIDAPKAEEPLYVSRNNKHAINVVLVCGPKYQFFFVSAMSPGSFHDSRALKISQLWKTWDIEGWRPDNDRNSIILGDSAYPLREWLLPPTIRVAVANDRRLARGAQAYLKSHRKTRFIVECAIGILKEEYPCLNNFRFQNPSHVCIAIYATVTLHNMQNIFRNGSYAYDAALNRIFNQTEPEHDSGNDVNHEAAADAGILMQRRILEHFSCKPKQMK